MENKEQEQARRIEELLVFITQVASGDLSSRMEPSDKQDDIDGIIQGLNMLAEEIEHRSYTKSEADARAEEILGAIMAIAALDYDRRVKVLGTGDVFDGVASGLNMLAEELKSSTVSNEYMDNILKSMLDMMIVLRKDGTIESANDSLLHSLSYSEEDILKMNVNDLFKRDFVKKHIENISDSDSKKINEAEIENANGELIPVSFSLSLMEGANDERLILVMQDISEKKAAEAEKIEKDKLALKTSILEGQNKIKSGLNELTETLMGNLDLKRLGEKIINFVTPYLRCSVGVIYFWDDEESVLELSGSYALSADAGVKKRVELKEGIVGQVAYEKSPYSINDVPEDYIKVSTSLGEMKPKFIYVFPVLFEGDVRAVVEIASINEFTDEDYEFILQSQFIIGASIESTASRLKTEQLLQESQALSEELQNQSEELRETNEQLEEQTQALEQAQDEIKKRNTDLELSKVALEERAKQIEEASRYKSEFLANMSHELRTPLNSILILSKILFEKNSSLNENEKKHAKTIYDAGYDLLRLINDILDLSKIEAGKVDIQLNEVDVRDIVNNLNDAFSAQAEQKGLTLQKDVEDDAPNTIVSDRDKILQILKNFISNALKFTKEGSIKIRVYPRMEEGKKQIAFAVSDTGIGIPHDKQQMIFEAFHQVDGSISREFGGTGLGLAISKNLAGILGGRIDLKSEERKGSIFTLSIPLEKEGAISDAEMEEEIQKDIAGAFVKMGEKDSVSQELIEVADDRGVITADDEVLLIVEDDKRFAHILAAEARQNGYKVIIAISGTQGIDYAYSYSPNAIILDIQLPYTDGWQVLRTLKRNPGTRHIPVQIISVVNEKNFGYKLGAINYLVKPVDTMQIEEVFSRFDDFTNRSEQNLIVVEDNAGEQEAIVELINAQNVKIDTASTGKEALEMIKSKHYDCMILDLKLPDMSGEDLLRMLSVSETPTVPTIVYTGKDLSREEENSLRELAECVILKTADSPARLLEESAIFLHQVHEKMDENKKQMLKDIAKAEESFRDKKILIVDDDFRNIYALTAALENKGLNIVNAENGARAIELLENETDVDLVIMDIMMPVMDGYTAIEKIRESKKFGNLPIIALTAKAMKGDKEKCISVGASDYISKPVDYDRLFSLIKIWLFSKG